MRKVKSLIIATIWCLMSFISASNLTYANSDLYHYADTEELDENSKEKEEEIAEEIVFESKKVEEKVNAGDEYIFVCIALLMSLICGKIGLTLLKDKK